MAHRHPSVVACAGPTPRTAGAQVSGRTGSLRLCLSHSQVFKGHVGQSVCACARFGSCGQAWSPGVGAREPLVWGPWARTAGLRLAPRPPGSVWSPSFATFCPVSPTSCPFPFSHFLTCLGRQTRKTCGVRGLGSGTSPSRWERAGAPAAERGLWVGSLKGTSCLPEPRATPSYLMHDCVTCPWL